MQVENFLSFDTNPLYALMQETIYCQVSYIVQSWLTVSFSDNYYIYFLVLFYETLLKENEVIWSEKEFLFFNPKNSPK